jgi:probable phosphoglycerate mutase
MKNIYVVTHTESIHHIKGRVGGWFDTGLTENGKKQAASVAKRLDEWIVTEKPSITSSDLLRAKETAEIVAATFGREYLLNPDFREMSYGVAEGKPQEWLDERIVPAPDDDRLDHLSIEGGESKRDFIARIYRAVDGVIADDNPNQIIVTHGFALTFVVARWVGLPAESAGLINFRSSSGGITHLQQDDFWRNRGVRILNDTSHLST